MAGLFGALGFDDSDRIFADVPGQQVVYNAIVNLLKMWNTEVTAAYAVFVERTTTDHLIRYNLPGFGRLQLKGEQAPAGSSKATGNWQIALPLKDYGEALGTSRVSLAYMTAGDMERHIETIQNKDLATRRYNILRALLNNTILTFQDERRGALSVQPLANGDAVVFPPINGAEVEATEDHYLVSGYTAANISATNNPYVTIRDDLNHHFGGGSTGGDNVIVFNHPDETAEIEAIAGFDEVPDRFIQPGNDTAVPRGFPAGVPGRVLGRISGCWAVEYAWVPSAYMLAIYADGSVPAPLLERLDEAGTGLPAGLTLLATIESFPHTSAQWGTRYGLGVGNRLNGIVMQFKASGSYDIPTAYA